MRAHILIDSAQLVLARSNSAGIDQPDARYAVSQLQFKYMRETGDWKAWARPAIRHDRAAFAAHSDTARTIDGDGPCARDSDRPRHAWRHDAGVDDRSDNCEIRSLSAAEPHPHGSGRVPRCSTR